MCFFPPVLEVIWHQLSDSVWGEPGPVRYQTGVLLPEWSKEAAAKISELVSSRAPNASSVSRQ